MATTVDEQTQAPEPAARAAEASKLFRYSDYVDLGEGASECEHDRDGQCEDREHFHAWIRLPNPYQHEDIRKKALAAKARRLREMRDRDSDAAVILDEALAQLADELYRGLLVDELMTNDWTGDYLEANRVVEREEEFEHIAQDREELGRLRAEFELPEEEQSDEFQRLTEHVRRHGEAVNAALAEIQEPKRAEYAARPLDLLLDAVRKRRVDQEADRAFIEAYNPWIWFVGTYKVDLHPTLGRPHLPMWSEIGRRDAPVAGTMYAESPEVIEALRDRFGDLQLALQRGSLGN